MTTFFVFNPQLGWEDFQALNTTILHQLGWRFDVYQKKTVAHIEFSVAESTGRFIIEYVSIAYVNISVKIPIDIGDTQRCFAYIQKYIQLYQLLYANLKVEALA
jgi:hypothetical protein